MIILIVICWFILIGLAGWGTGVIRNTFWSYTLFVLLVGSVLLLLNQLILPLLQQ